MDLTTCDEVVALMKSSKSESEWNRNCDQVKKANGGYPGFWYEAIVQSGVSARTSAGWGGDDEIHIVAAVDPKLGPKDTFGRKADLCPINIRVSDTDWKSGGPSSYELRRLGVQDSDHVVCGYDQGLGEKLHDCGLFKDTESVRRRMVSLWESYAAGYALRIGWYRLPAGK